MARNKMIKKNTTSKRKTNTKAKKVSGFSFWQSRGGVIVALLFVALFGGIGIWQLNKSNAATTTDINVWDRDAVNSAYKSLWKSGVGVSTGWTGSLSGCIPGKSSVAGHTAAINAINFARRMNALTPIIGSYSTDATKNLNAQKSALIMEANGALNHNPPSSWKCWTKVGATAASQSNLALQAPSITPLDAVNSMMDEPGSSNYPAGHRRWLLNPFATDFGFGFTKTAASIQVIGLNQNTANSDPAWVMWPARGYFPNNLEPNGRWSLTARSTKCFNNATVKITSGGTNIPVTILSKADRKYGNPTIVWQMPSSFNKATTYNVTVSNINKWNATNKVCSTASDTKLTFSSAVYLFAPY